MEQGISFGEKYILLDLLGTGGMAEVYKGKLLGEEGFEKQVVIKKLLDEHTGNRELVQVFIGEAKLAALLQHDNIATTYDFGQASDQYFLAMEYLAGKDLFTVLQKAKETESLLPIEQVLLICSKICEGMEYAHTVRDLENKPLNLVHRDLTPHNIFITYEGKIKIIDFGIARAELIDNKTKEGVVKGKISYMSPEQLTGDKIDKRSDIFSIGIILYEMISSQRMYTGDTGELIRKCITVDYQPLEEVKKDLHKGIYPIVRKALTKNIDERYQTCAELKADIEDLLFELKSRPDATLLKQYIQDLFPLESEHEKQLEPLSSEQKNLAQKASEADTVDHTAGTNEVSHEKTASYSQLHKEIQGEKTEFISNPKLIDKKPKLLLMFAAASFLSLVFILFALQKNDKNLPNIQPPSTIAEKTEHNDTSPENRQLLENVSASSQAQKAAEKYFPQQYETEELLSSAHLALQLNRLLPPDKNSAYSLYKKALSLEPENNVAKDGLRQIGDKYAAMAEDALARKNYKQAEKMIQNGEIASPASQRLQMIAERIRRERQQEIAALARQAERCLKEYKLTTPKNDSAELYYRKILSIDTESKLAKTGMKKIADRYLFLANKEYKGFDYGKARYFVEKGLSVSPNHNELRGLNRELTKSSPELFLKSLEHNLNSIFSK